MARVPFSLERFKSPYDSLIKEVMTSIEEKQSYSGTYKGATIKIEKSRNGDEYDLFFDNHQIRYVRTDQIPMYLDRFYTTMQFNGRVMDSDFIIQSDVLRAKLKSRGFNVANITDSELQSLNAVSAKVFKVSDSLSDDDIFDSAIADSKPYSKWELINKPPRWISDFECWDKAVDKATHDGEKETNVIVPIVIYKRMVAKKQREEQAEEVGDSSISDSIESSIDNALHFDSDKMTDKDLHTKFNQLCNVLSLTRGKDSPCNRLEYTIKNIAEKHGFSIPSNIKALLS